MVKQQPYMKGKVNRDIVNALTAVLADTFVLYFKTHSFHWNVEGPRFKELHDLFSVQYNELWTATDEIAERIRALDAYAPLSFKDILRHATLKETGQMPDTEGMIGALEEDNRAIVESVFNALHTAGKADDQGTVDMMIGRSQVHEKAAWMLGSLLKKG